MSVSASEPKSFLKTSWQWVTMPIYSLLGALVIGFLVNSIFSFLIINVLRVSAGNIFYMFSVPTLGSLISGFVLIYLINLNSPKFGFNVSAFFTLTISVLFLFGMFADIATQQRESLSIAKGAIETIALCFGMSTGLVYLYKKSIGKNRIKAIINHVSNIEFKDHPTDFYQTFEIADPEKSNLAVEIDSLSQVNISDKKSEIQIAPTKELVKTSEPKEYIPSPYELGLSNSTSALVYLNNYLLNGADNDKRLAASAVGKLSNKFPKECNTLIPALLRCVLDKPHTQICQYALITLDKLDFPSHKISLLEHVSKYDKKEYNRESANKILSKFNTNTNTNTNSQTNAFAKELKRIGFEKLYHMTHIDNVPKILAYGIESHNVAHSRFSPVDISLFEAQQYRTKPDPINGRSLHDYAPMYFNSRNPMLYRKKEIQHEICILEINLNVLNSNKFIYTDGNAAAFKTKFYSSIYDVNHIPKNVLNSGRWTEFEDGKRKCCAEVLLYPKVLPTFIDKIHCKTPVIFNRLINCGKEVSISRNMYF